MEAKLKRAVVSYFLGFLCFYGSLVAFLYLMQRHILYCPNTHRPVPASSGMTDMKVITVSTADGLKLAGWYTSPASEGKPVVVIFHGNGGNIGALHIKARPMINKGYGVLLAEYRGYGGNPGSPSEQGLYADARAYLSWLKAQGMSPARIVLYGESLGTGVASRMAAETPGYAAVVLETPYSSMVDLAQRKYFYVPVRLLLKDRYDNIANIKRVNIPVLVIYGDRDNIIPNSEEHAVFDNANEPKSLVVIPGGHHQDLYARGAADKVLSFLDNLKH